MNDAPTNDASHIDTERPPLRLLTFDRRPTTPRPTTPRPRRTRPASPRPPIAQPSPEMHPDIADIAARLGKLVERRPVTLRVLCVAISRFLINRAGI